MLPDLKGGALKPRNDVQLHVSLQALLPVFARVAVTLAHNRQSIGNTRSDPLSHTARFCALGHGSFATSSRTRPQSKRFPSRMS